MSFIDDLDIFDSGAEEYSPATAKLPREMFESLILTLPDLRVALLRLISEIEQHNGAEIDLAADYYWTVGAAAAFGLESEPAPTVGQLSDDLISTRWPVKLPARARRRRSGTTWSTWSASCVA